MNKFFKWANPGLFLFIFVLYKLLGSAGFELRSSESTLSTWPPPPRPMSWISYTFGYKAFYFWRQLGSLQPTAIVIHSLTWLLIRTSLSSKLKSSKRALDVASSEKRTMVPRNIFEFLIWKKYIFTLKYLAVISVTRLGDFGKDVCNKFSCNSSLKDS